MLVWLASYPRSGNTFFRCLLQHLCGVPSSEKPLMPNSPLIQSFGIQPVRAHSYEEIAAWEEVAFVKTHELPGNNSYPAVYLVRDGRDALVSYAYHTLVYDRGMQLETIDLATYCRTLHDLILEQRSPFGTWARNVEAWTARPNTIVLRFEELIRQPTECLSQVIEELALPIKIKKQAAPTFAELHEIEPTFFRRGKVGSWRDEFPPDLLALFWQQFRPTMTRLGYGSDDTKGAKTWFRWR